MPMSHPYTMSYINSKCVILFQNREPKNVWILAPKMSEAHYSKHQRQQPKSPKPQHFREFFIPKTRQFSREIKVEFLDRKWRFRTVWSNIRKLRLANLWRLLFYRFWKLVLYPKLAWSPCKVVVIHYCTFAICNFFFQSPPSQEVKMILPSWKIIFSVVVALENKSFGFFNFQVIYHWRRTTADLTA